MKEKNREVQRLFDSARNAIPEIEFDRIKSLVETFPELTETPVAKNNWNNLFKFKNGLIMTISISIITIALFFFNTSPTSEYINTDQAVEYLEAENSYQKEKDNKALTAVVAKESGLKKENTEAKTSLDDVRTEPNALVSLQEIETKNLRLNRDKINMSDKKPNVDDSYLDTQENTIINDAQKISIENQIEDYIYVTSNDSGLETDPSSLGNLKLRRLRKLLYKNLLADNLIKAKHAYVTIDLSGSSIIVNGIAIEDSLYQKYLELTSEAGHGKYRKIKMSHQYIKVGDFTEEGFTGEGFGTFTEDFEPSEYRPYSMNDKDGNVQFVFEKENADLKALADEIFDPYYGGTSKGLFHVDLKFENLLDLHKGLYTILIQDGFVASRKFPAIIEISKNGLRINGEKIEGQQKAAYQALIDKNKIKPGPFRSIRLTEHQIFAGDFGPGIFTGTSSTIGDY